MILHWSPHTTSFNDFQERQIFCLGDLEFFCIRGWREQSNQRSHPYDNFRHLNLTNPQKKLQKENSIARTAAKPAKNAISIFGFKPKSQNYAELS